MSSFKKLDKRKKAFNKVATDGYFPEKKFLYGQKENSQ